MITNIYLVRHANSVYTPDELNRPLSEIGFEDADRVFDLLSKEDITHVISSPYKRAIQTVEGIAKEIDKEIVIVEGFKERKLASEPVEDFQESIIKLWSDFSFSFQGGESNNAAQLRGVNALNEVLEKYEGGNIAIGTHGNIMVLIMNYFDKRYNYDFWKTLNMPDIYRMQFRGKNLEKVERGWK